MSGETVVEVRRDVAIARWRPLSHWLIGAPNLLATGVTTALSIVLALVMAPVVLVTGRVLAGVVAFQAMCVRVRVRAFSHFFVLRSSTPPVGLRMLAADPGDDAHVTVSVAPGPHRASRLEVLVRPVVLVPHVLALLPIGFVMDVCYPVWMVLVAVNGAWPPSLARLLAAVERWVAAVFLYATLATDERPRFGLHPAEATDASAVAATA